MTQESVNRKLVFPQLITSKSELWGLNRNGSLREPTGCLGSIETVYTVNVLMHKNMGYPICSHVTSVVFCKKKHLYRFSPLDIFFLRSPCSDPTLFTDSLWRGIMWNFFNISLHVWPECHNKTQETYKPQLFRQKEGVSRMHSEQGFEFQTCLMNLVNE